MGADHIAVLAVQLPLLAAVQHGAFCDVVGTANRFCTQLWERKWATILEGSFWPTVILWRSVGVILVQVGRHPNAGEV
jgi:hypothetical protein